MKVKVTAKTWGTYVKGDELDMHPATAKAIAEKGFVKILPRELTPKEVEAAKAARDAKEAKKAAEAEKAKEAKAAEAAKANESLKEGLPG